LVVTRHGVPLVRIVPLEPADAPSGIWDAVAEREAQYGRLTDEFELPDRDASPIRPDPLE